MVDGRCQEYKKFCSNLNDGDINDVERIAADAK